MVINELIINNIRREFINLNRIINQRYLSLLILFNGFCLHHPEYPDTNQKDNKGCNITTTCIIEVDFLVLNIIGHNLVIVIYNILDTSCIGCIVPPGERSVTRILYNQQRLVS